MSLPQPEDRATCLSSSLLTLVSDEEGIESLKDLIATFVHRTRNLLNGIKMSLYILRRGATGKRSVEWAELERVYGAIESLLDRLQMIYKARRVNRIRCPLGQLIRDRMPSWGGLLERRGLVLDIDAPTEDDTAEFDPSSFSLALDAFVSWRAEVAPAGTRSLLGWRINGDHVELWWREDEPDARSTAASTHSPAANEPSMGIDTLALPLLARITAIHGGVLDARRDPELVMTLRWPRFCPTGQDASPPTKLACSSD